MEDVKGKPLNLKFHCTLDELTAAAQRTLNLRNLMDADSILKNLLHTINKDGVVQSISCRKGEDEDKDKYIVILQNYEEDQNGELTSDPTDGSKFQEVVKALQNLIFCSAGQPAEPRPVVSQRVEPETPESKPPAYAFEY